MYSDEIFPRPFLENDTFSRRSRREMIVKTKIPTIKTCRKIKKISKIWFQSTTVLRTNKGQINQGQNSFFKNIYPGKMLIIFFQSNDVQGAGYKVRQVVEYKSYTLRSNEWLAIRFRFFPALQWFFIKSNFSLLQFARFGWL